jgi:hypothetical protein
MDHDGRASRFLSLRGSVRTLAGMLGLMTGFPIAADVVEGWLDETSRATARLWRAWIS